MRITQQGLAEFASHLEQGDLWASPTQSCLTAAHGCCPGMPDDMMESLVVFEGALAWETGASRSAPPPIGGDWAKDAWLSGWDWADRGYGYRAVTPLDVETH